jgi:hypothetical protein
MARLGPVLRGLAGAALLAGAPAWAQPVAAAADPAPAAPTDVGGVTVTAEKKDPLVDKTTQFVRSHVPETRGGQIARFRDAVCVNVVGLPPTYSAFIAKRVVKVAAEVKAPVDHRANCTPNVNVIFTPDPQAQLDDIAKRREILMGFHWAAQMKQLATFDRPIQSWYLTRAVGTDGQSVLELNHGSTFQDNGPGAPPENIGGTITGRPGSRLGADTSSELVHALILVDAKKVSNLKIGAVADYIALLALSRWQGLERCNAASTILNLMAEGCAEDPPEAVTDSDVGLLTALYTADPRETGTQQRASIAERMAQAARNASAKETH